MECNKDEAVRAKEIAERKFTERNYASARKFAVKAQNLYPGLDGLSQMMTTIDVHAAAENKVNGEMDWYGILGVTHLADDETIRKQYRKLALTLHPDKNKSLGAEGAFKLVSEAWSLLSDKEKRLAYNRITDSKRCQQKVPTHTTPTPSAAPGSNGFPNFSSNVTSGARNPQSTAARASTTSSQRKPETFWTLCNRCKTHYEYLRTYLNHTLLCPNCHEAFLALEKSPPPNVLKPSNLSYRQQHQNSRQNQSKSNAYNLGRNSGVSHNSESGSAGLNSFNNRNFQWGPSSRTAAQAASVVQRASEKVRRDRDDSQSAAEWERNQVLKKQRMNDDRSHGYGVHMANQMTGRDGVAGPGGGLSEASRMYGLNSAYPKINGQRELSIVETRNMLMYKARTEICKKLKEWRLSSGGKTVGKGNNKVQKSVANGKSFVISKRRQDKSSVGSSADDNTGGKTNEMLTINVPDSDFHNFDSDRTEASFGDDQVWAAYDDDDGMPRFYARIHKVMSRKPFKMRISWLNSRTCSEFSPLDWVGLGFIKVCGDFRVGRYETSGSLNSFSHRVHWEKGMRGAVRIFPQKGEIWALYRNWSNQWNENTLDEIVHKYEMVEVVDDFNEEQGISVTPLVKVPGFRTVFHKSSDTKEVRRILKEEMFRFSHQVPSYLLTGKEADNSPEGCRELDPAATPVDLLTEANDSSMMTQNGKDEETLQSGPEKKVNIEKPMEVEEVDDGPQIEGVR